MLFHSDAGITGVLYLEMGVLDIYSMYYICWNI
jgi:hypothetical protein